MTATTPIYALPYQAEGDPMYLYRQTMQDLVTRLETVLALGGAAAPGATDLLTLAGRVGTLETDQAAEDTLRASTAVTFSTGFGQFATSPYGELVKCWKTAPDRVHVAGIVSVVNAVTAGSTALPMFTLPVGYRPAVQLLRRSWFAPGAVGSAAPIPFRLQVTTAGVVQLIAHVAIAAGSWLQLDELTFRTVNT